MYAACGRCAFAVLVLVTLVLSALISYADVEEFIETLQNLGQ